MEEGKDSQSYREYLKSLKLGKKDGETHLNSFDPKKLDRKDHRILNQYRQGKLGLNEFQSYRALSRDKPEKESFINWLAQNIQSDILRKGNKKK